MCGCSGEGSGGRGMVSGGVSGVDRLGGVELGGEPSVNEREVWGDEET